MERKVDLAVGGSDHGSDRAAATRRGIPISWRRHARAETRCVGRDGRGDNALGRPLAPLDKLYM